MFLFLFADCFLLSTTTPFLLVLVHVCVHSDFLYEYAFVDVWRLHLPRSLALLFCFMASAVVHEVILTFSFGFLCKHFVFLDTSWPVLCRSEGAPDCFFGSLCRPCVVRVLRWSWRGTHLVCRIEFQPPC